MLSLRTLPRCINFYFKQTNQHFHTSLKLLAKDSSSSSSSDSSDSSDSDSDSDKKNQKVIKVDNAEMKVKSDESSIPKNAAEALLQILTQASKKSKEKSETSGKKLEVPHIVLKPKAEKLKTVKVKEVQEKSFEEQLAEAAKDAAQSLEGDAKEIEIELLGRLFNLDKPMTDKTNETPSVSNLDNLLTGMKVEKAFNVERQKLQKQFSKRNMESSISSALLYQKSITNIPRKRHEKFVELSRVHSKLDIFQNISKEKQDTSLLSMWNEIEKRELYLSQLVSPQNIFEEHILWTKQGKLWHFPINNEQGWEEEEKVHFSEHVFMERHLKGWCPKRGPIRHFMELVCTGLSKNPYMTVEEKVGHITWYKNFFENKKDLLNELGILDSADPKVDSKKQIKS